MIELDWKNMPTDIVSTEFCHAFVFVSLDSLPVIFCHLLQSSIKNIVAIILHWYLHLGLSDSTIKTWMDTLGS